jgi:hypothetical protein
MLACEEPDTKQIPAIGALLGNRIETPTTVSELSIRLNEFMAPHLYVLGKQAPDQLLHVLIVGEICENVPEMFPKIFLECHNNNTNLSNHLTGTAELPFLLKAIGYGHDMGKTAENFRIFFNSNFFAKTREDIAIKESHAAKGAEYWEKMFRSRLVFLPPVKDEIDLWKRLMIEGAAYHHVFNPTKQYPNVDAEFCRSLDPFICLLNVADHLAARCQRQIFKVLADPYIGVLYPELLNQRPGFEKPHNVFEVFTNMKMEYFNRDASGEQVIPQEDYNQLLLDPVILNRMKRIY